MLFVARCFHCDWGLTQGQKAVSDASRRHIETCPGPVVALQPTAKADGGTVLTFRSHLRCNGCGLPKTVCVCQRVDD
jgi:hypothetical protein